MSARFPPLLNVSEEEEEGSDAHAQHHEHIDGFMRQDLVVFNSRCDIHFDLIRDRRRHVDRVAVIDSSFIQ